MECSFEGCTDEAKARELCGTHYEQQRSGKPLTAKIPQITSGGPCLHSACGRDRHAAGYCKTHYKRSRAGTDMDAPIKEYRPASGSCLEAECIDPVFRSGLCGKHYRAMRRSNAAECAIQECPNPTHTADLCNLHYKRMIRLGDPSAGRGRSAPEEQLLNLVRSMTTLQVVHNDRSVIAPYELDIWIPELCTAIEFDGDYWHSLPGAIERDALKDHLCRESGVRLMRIRESDWYSHQARIKEEVKEIFA